MLIDCHVHLNNYYIEEGRHPRPTRENVERLFREMAQHGVDHAVVLTSYLVDVERPAVEEILEILAEDPRTTVIEGLRWRSDKRTDLFMMEERIRDGVVKGIKLYPGYDRYPINDPSLEAVFRIAEKHGVPVMIHCGDTFAKGAKVRMAHPLLVDDVAVDFPDVRFVICHLGNPWFVDAAEVLYKNENVYADVSGLALVEPGEAYTRFLADGVQRLVAYLGDPGPKLMYGTDWPLADMGMYRRLFDSLGLPEASMDGILWKTAAEMFRIEVPARRSPAPGTGERGATSCNAARVRDTVEVDSRVGRPPKP